MTLLSIRKINNSLAILRLKNLSYGISKLHSITIALAAVFGMPKFSSPATCYSFPKIFGGAGDSTWLYHIDVFADYLAMVGSTYDTTLTTGLTSGSRPFIAVTSVAIPDYYYWAKMHSLKTSTEFYGVQFSIDGTLLITHSYSASNFIVVYDVATGAVKSARSYSSGGY